MRILYDDDAVQAVYRPGSSDFTLITFGDKDLRPAPGRFWAGEPAEQLNLDCIGIVAKGPNWYPAAAMVRCAPFLSGVGRQRRLGYGYSMGGYAALRHGRLLGLTHALAVSPQVSLDPRDVPWDRRYAAHFDPALHAGMAVRREHLADETFVLADPWDAEDGAHLRLALEAGPLRSVVAPFVGHWAIWLLAGRSVLARALACVLAGDAPGLRRLVRSGRGACAPWHACLGAAALRRGHVGPALRLAAQAEARGFDAAVLEPMLAHGAGVALSRLVASGATAEDLARFGEAASGLVAAARIDDAVGHALLRADRDEEAALAFRRALSADPGLGSAHGGLSLALARLGRAEEALTHARQAHALDPADAELAAWVGYVLLQSGRAEEAVGMFETGIRLNPGMGHAHRARARALRDLGLGPEAAAAAEEGCRAVPSDAALRQLADELRPHLERGGERRTGWLRLPGSAPTRP
ncbi:tetratricopeptide repeat protein [Roseomonas sp. CCTCC AB2023176]|uniref:tetratricopeptide repeat protein n=1 Tax=Roseomonas sp. CCTCC AB2023176 TaxID=3342640 RepID=UPI0035D84C63